MHDDKPWLVTSGNDAEKCSGGLRHVAVDNSSGQKSGEKSGCSRLYGGRSCNVRRPFTASFLRNVSHLNITNQGQIEDQPDENVPSPYAHSAGKLC